MSYVLTINQINDLRQKRHFPKETKARIVPFFITTNTKECYFLLGKEHFNNKPSRGIYNMLGGCREPHETIFECAQRELLEETIGILLFNVHSTPFIIQRNRRYIFFVPYVGSPMKLLEEFNHRKAFVHTHNYAELTKIMGYPVNSSNITHLNEIDELLWVSESQIYGPHIYRSVIDVFQTMGPQNILAHLKN